MHVGLDLLFLVPGETGGRETYARELLRSLRLVRPDLRITTFLNRETAAAGSGFWNEHADRAVVLRRASARARGSWATGELVGVARAAAAADVDVLHSAANFAPLHGPYARVLTLHDLIFRALPELMPPAVRLATEALVVPAAKRAHRVLTVSEASRHDIVERLGLVPERVVAIPNGIVAPAMDGTQASGDAGRARRRFELPPGPMALAVASDVAHKNLAALVDGVTLLDPEQRPLLVLAGHGTDAGPLLARARERGVGSSVRILGAVSSEALEDLYAAASVLVTATRYEGFGLPVLEAMARGVPVVCSDLPVLREVGGDAVAGWLDPERPDTVAAALHLVLRQGPVERERVRVVGRARAAAFTWEAAAAATARVYEQALADARRFGATR